MMTARTGLATRAATRCWYPNCPSMLPRFGFLEFTFWQTHQFCRYRNERGPGVIPCSAPAAATSVCCCPNVPHPASVASLIRQHSLAIVLCRAAWVGQLPLAIPFCCYLALSLCSFLPLSLYLSRSFSVCLANWSLGFCVWKEALWFLICLSAFARWILSIMWSPSLGLSLCLPLPPSLPRSLSCFVCTAIWGLSAVGNRADCLS